MSYHVRDTCRLCASPDLERLLTLPDTPLANEYPQEVHNPFPSVPALGRAFMEQDRFPLYLVGCNACGHVQLPVVVDPKRLFPPDYPYQSGTSPVFREHLVKLAATLAGMFPRDGYGRYKGACPVFLDVACNDGTLVDELYQQHILAFGIDPAAPKRVHFYQDFFGTRFVEEAKKHRTFHDMSMDCITALNVFAHVDDLDDFTRGVKTLLEPCGLFVIEVGYLPDVIARGAFDTIYHEHLSYHHLSPLVRFFRKHGMSLVDAQRIDSQGGSVRLYVRNCDKEHVGGDDGHNEVSARLQTMLDDEGRSSIWNGVRGLDKARNDERKWLLSFSRHHKLTGKPIAIYGAPAKLTTYLAATQLFPDRVGLVVDDNPLKVGRYVPGTRLRIEPTSKLSEYQPTGILCASWNFAEDIQARHAGLDAEWFVPFEKRRPETCPGGHDLDERGYCAPCDVTVSYR